MLCSLVIALILPGSPLAAVPVPAQVPRPHTTTTVTRIYAWGRMWDAQGFLLLPDGTRQTSDGGYWRLYQGWPYWYVTQAPYALGSTRQGFPRIYGGQ